MWEKRYCIHHVRSHLQGKDEGRLSVDTRMFEVKYERVNYESKIICWVQMCYGYFLLPWVYGYGYGIRICKNLLAIICYNIKYETSLSKNIFQFAVITLVSTVNITKRRLGIKHVFPCIIWRFTHTFGYFVSLGLHTLLSILHDSFDFPIAYSHILTRLSH